jgi:hypothetical protein
MCVEGDNRNIDQMAAAASPPKGSARQSAEELVMVGNTAIEWHSLRGLDQWVRTKHNNAPVTGRIVAVLESQGSETLYEVELPLLDARHGQMAHVARLAHELRSIGIHTVEGIHARH